MTVTVALDVDGTLISTAPGEPTAIEDVRTLLRILSERFDTRIIVWSGSGELYARMVARQIHINRWVHEYHAKDAAYAPDITIDDLNIGLGKVNLLLMQEKGTA